MKHQILCGASQHAGKCLQLGEVDWPDDAPDDRVAASLAGYLCEACATAAPPKAPTPTLDERIAAVEAALAGKSP